MSTKTRLKADWDSEKLRKESVKLMAIYEKTIWDLLKDNPGLIDQCMNSFISCSLQEFEERNLDSPVKVAQFIAEVFTNLAGASIEICGDDQTATIDISSMELIDEVARSGKFSPVEKSTYVGMCGNWLAKMAEACGYKSECHVSESLGISVTLSK